ncbi:hypothetical protein LCGC14_1955640, partial [marine sediment metagenome]
DSTMEQLFLGCRITLVETSQVERSVRIDYPSTDETSQI